MDPDTAEQAKPVAKHYEVITETDVGEVFGFGSYTLTKREAAKRLAKLTGGHRTSCYRALRLQGRFGRHLHLDGAMLSWR
jgi:alkylated DNA nucleotide flippase Atl1